MSEKLTKIRLPGQKVHSGFANYGEHSADDMIAQYRSYAATLRRQADIIEAAADCDFQIDVVRGVHREKHLRTLQHSRINTNQDPQP